MTKPKIHPLLASQHYGTLAQASHSTEAGRQPAIGRLSAELLHDIDLIIAASAREEIVPNDTHVQQAHSRLVALEQSVRLEVGGSLAPIMARMYQLVGDELNNWVKSGDPAVLSRVREAVSTVGYAWVALTVV